jgi:ATP-dependent Clp protease adaptor protein ClpS
MEVCRLEPIQAEQCTHLVHYKGKCDVKKGNYTTLRAMKEALIERGLTAEIN